MSESARPERPEDISSIYTVHRTAFGREAEADLTDALRRNGRLTLSLAGIEEGRVVAHIAFSPMTVRNERSGGKDFLALGPVATLPEFRRRGISSELIRAGLARCRERGYTAVCVLGNPAFYQRFGFVRASDRNVFWERPGFEGVFQIAELTSGGLARLGDGPCIVGYAPEFDAV